MPAGIGHFESMPPSQKYAPIRRGIALALVALLLFTIFYSFQEVLIILVNIPLALPANWVFRVTEYPETRIYLSGLKKGIVILIVGPLLFICFIVFLFLWGWGSALLLVLFTLGIALILLELLFWNFAKIPFACSYLPGKAKIHMFAVIYFLAFLVYAVSLSSLVSRLLDSPYYLPGYLLMVSLLLYVMHALQYRDHSEHASLLFEDEPDSLVSLFERSE